MSKKVAWTDESDDAPEGKSKRQKAKRRPNTKAKGGRQGKQPSCQECGGKQPARNSQERRTGA